MTLIIDMASGAPFEDTATSCTRAEPVADHRLHMPAGEPGLALVPEASTRATAGMPASLRDRDIECFLDGMA